jgi:hypothetical protein
MNRRDWLKRAAAIFGGMLVPLTWLGWRLKEEKHFKRASSIFSGVPIMGTKWPVFYKFDFVVVDQEQRSA